MTMSFTAKQARRQGNAIEFPLEDGVYKVTVRVERADQVAMDKDPVLVYSTALKSLTFVKGYAAG